MANTYSTASAPAPVYQHTASVGPLEGFMPYQGDYGGANDSWSMEYFYIPLSAVLTAPDTYDWSYIDTRADDIASRGHQAVFRVYLDYPGTADEMNGEAVPQFIWDMGVQKFSYDDFGGGVNPDYKDQRLIDILVKFVAAYAQKYDGDPRVGFIEAGLIGHWGEWHTYSDQSKMPSTDQINQIYAAYNTDFTHTKILIRYGNLGDTVGNSNLGFHDDSFAYSTLPGDSNNFYPQLSAGGVLDRWQSAPIGGELRPEIQEPFFDGDAKTAVNYYKSVTLTHCSWLLCQQVAQSDLTDPAITAVYTKATQAMGYDLTATAADLQCSDDGALQVSLTVANNGVAPFYYNWPVKIVLLDKNGKIAQSFDSGFDISLIQPGTTRDFAFSTSGLRLLTGDYTVALSIPNPMPGGLPLLFSNADAPDGYAFTFGALTAK